MTHLSTDDLLDRLYGIAGSAVEAHLAGCSECSQRYAAFEQRRAESSASCEVSDRTLAAQRRAIYARIEEQPPASLRWAPALALLCLLAIGLWLYPSGTRRAAPSPHPEISDEQLFSDVYSIEESAEPRAATPIHALFEDAVFEEGGP